MPTISELNDTLYTTTWQKMKGDATDNIFDATPFWFWMKENGRFRTEEGGRWIGQPLRFAKSDNIAWIKKGGTVAMDDLEFLTTAQYYWRYLTDSIVRFGVDEQQNRGKAKIIDLMQAKLDNSQDSLIDALETRLFGTQTGDSMEGLIDLVPDAGTGTVGTIDSSVDTWWQSKQTDLTGLSFAVHGVPAMRSMINNTGNNLRSDQIDIIVSGQVPYEYYEDDVVEQKRIVNQSLGDAGFDNIQYKGKPMIWSPSCADTRMYFLNTKFLWLVYDPAMFFDMTDWKAIPNQVNDRVAQIASAMNLVVSRRRCQGVIHTIDTA